MTEKEVRDKYELKIGRHVAFALWDARTKYSGYRVGRIMKVRGNKLTVKLSNGVKRRIAKSQVYGVVWFKKIRRFRPEMPVKVSRRERSESKPL